MLRRAATLLALLMLLAVPLGLLLPSFVPAVVRARGVAVSAARWCGAGLCLGEASVGRVRVAAAELGWYGVLVLHDVVVVDATSRSAAVARSMPEADASANELAAIPFVRAVRVEGLVVEGTPLPPLSGSLFPERHLVGPGARIDGDEAELRLPTEYGEVTVRVTPAERGRAVTASCVCTLTHPALGGVLADRNVEATGVLIDDEFTGDLTVEGVTVQLTAHIGGTTTVSGRFVLPETRIAHVYGVFEPIVPELARAELRGSIAATGRFTLQPLSLHVKPTVSNFAVDGLVSSPYRYGTITWMGRDSQGGYVPRTGGDGESGWLPLPAFGEELPMAVIAAEDSGFLTHAGYDLEGMLTAADENAKAGEVVRGGSTLTQQLAKNLFLTGDRSYARKLRELLYAVEMERELGKTRILELYLNIVEWGPNIHGASAASEAYFLKSPRGLLPEEAAFLASILRNPRGGWATQYEGGRLDARRLAWILDNMTGLDPLLRREALAREIHFVPPP